VKVKSSIPSYIVFGLLLGLVQCSETAMRSAIYEPDLGEEAPAGPSEIPQGTRTRTSNRAERDGENNERRTRGEGETVPVNGVETESESDSNSFGVYGSLSEMRLTLTEKELLLGVLWPQASVNDVEISSIRMDLRTTEVVEELSERHLEGYLMFKAGGLRTRHLSNEEPVIFAAAGDIDIMLAQFRIEEGLLLDVEMKRVRSRTPEEADANPWEGRMTLIKKDGTRKEVGRLKGIVGLKEQEQ